MIFCKLMSQEIGVMLEQSRPSGQQIAALTESLVCRSRHVVPEPQQKSDGNTPPQGVSDLSPPHFAVSLVFSSARPASGSNSSGTHIARVDEGRSRNESASELEMVEESIAMVSVGTGGEEAQML